jgi:asparagine synthase (glutamine-hydrolysing)
MCGIAGLVQLGSGAPVVADTLSAMTGAMMHRGPDDQGLYVSPMGDCGLGARRLSIIDLGGGHQPLSNEDGTIWVVQNGEIYNYMPLRAELEGLGHRFRTNSDTEVIAHAYEEWGEDSVARLWGMFALAVWDERQRSILLARDRLGIKPLFIARDAAGSLLLFASEIKALLRHPALATPTLDARSLEDMFTVGFVPGPATIWREIRRLPPAHVLVARAGSGSTRRWRYWDAPYLPAGLEEAVDPREASEIVLDLLKDAVRLRLQSDVPVGALLSGGLDSAGIVSLMQELSAGRAHTFSIGFDAASHDESRYARLAASHLGTQHHVLRFGWRAFDHLPAVMASLDQPQCFATAVPISLLYRACHEAGFKVILTGEGSDELFAGYYWLRGNQRAETLSHLPLAMRRTLFHPKVPWPMSAAARRALLDSTWSPVRRYLGWLQVSSAGQREALFSPSLRAALWDSDRPDLGTRWEDEFRRSVASLAPLHRDLTLERCLRLPDFINHEVDAMSMAHSVEARVPYLDHRLWELLARWTPHLKSVPHRPEKWLLRRVYASYLPDAILQRRKQGLATPHSNWWRQPTLPDWVEEALAPQALQAGGLFVPETVGRWRTQHQARRGDFSALLTGVLNVQLWRGGGLSFSRDGRMSHAR